MTPSRSLRSQALDMLRFPLAVVVVIAHTFCLDDVVASGTVYRLTDYQLFMDANIFIDAFLRGISVPIYFFISGYVFFASIDFTADVYKKKLQNRFKSLFIPYIIWNALAVFLVIFKQLPIFSSFLSYSDSALDLSFRNIISCFWIYDGSLNPDPSVEGGGLIEGAYMPINTALWYLRDLMIIVLSTPVIYLLIKKFKVYALCLLLAVYMGSLHYNWPISMIAGGYFFFAWGAYMSIYRIDMIVAFKRWFRFSVIAYIINCIIYIVLYYRAPHIAGWIKVLNAFFALVACFNIAVWILQNTKVRLSPFLAASSYFIYISHCLFVGRLTKVLFMIIKPDDGFEILLVYLLTVVILVLSLLFVFYLLKRYCPSVLKVVAGRKS